jgi:hypothetical protein
MSKNNDFTSWTENNYGQLELGRLDPDNVRAGVYLSNKQDVRHRLYMDIDRPMGNGKFSTTTLESPGGIIIKTGQDRTRPDIVFNIQVENGKLCLTCQCGDVEIQGKNVTIEAAGSNGDDGVITLKSNSKIEMNSPEVIINGKQKCELNSENKMEIKSNGTIGMYGTQGVCQSASSRYGKRGASQEEKIVE